MKLTMTHSLSCPVILSKKKGNRDSKLMKMFMWLNLVSGKCLGSNADDMRKHIMTEKLNLKIKRGKVLTGESKEIRKISPDRDAIVVKTLVTFFLGLLS